MKIGSLVTAKHTPTFCFYYLTKDELHVEFDMINSGQDAALERNDWFMWGKTIRNKMKIGSLVTAKHNVAFSFYYLTKAELGVELDMINSGKARLERDDWYEWGKSIRQSIYTDVVYVVCDLRLVSRGPRWEGLTHSNSLEVSYVVLLDTKTGRELYCDQRDLVVVG